MINSLKPYASYRPTGLSWLGDAPEHWGVRRMKFLLREIDERSETGSEQLLRVSQYTGVTERKANSRSGIPYTRASSLVGYKLVSRNDLVINIMLAWNGSLGVSDFNGLTSPAYCVYRFGQETHPWYYHQLLRTTIYKDRIKAVSTGVVESRLRLYSDELGRIKALVPPPDEQAAIVKFLEYADSRIRRYIRAKQRLVKLLEEQKQAIIHQAVTRGLNPDAPMKDSGVEWLGEVPEHWEVTRVKNEFLCLNHKRIPLSSTERGAMTDKRYDYYGASGIIDKVEGYIFDDELLLIAEDGANLVLRNLPLMIIARGKFWVNNHAHILKPISGDIEFLAYFLEGLNYELWISGAAQPKLTKDRLLSISLSIPPKEEQEKIVDWIREATSTLQESIGKSKEEISLLREYRTRLIADVVTGKLDVGQAAAGLPDEIEQVDELDEDDALNEVDGLELESISDDSEGEEEA